MVMSYREGTRTIHLIRLTMRLHLYFEKEVVQPAHFTSNVFAVLYAGVARRLGRFSMEVML